VPIPAAITAVIQAAPAELLADFFPSKQTAPRS
jgi:hypothetical protein